MRTNDPRGRFRTAGDGNTWMLNSAGCMIGTNFCRAVILKMAAFAPPVEKARPTAPTQLPMTFVSDLIYPHADVGDATRGLSH